MAIYRQIQTSFWFDLFVLGLTPEEKYFYFYIMTNPSSTQCGIFEFSIMKAALETGYNIETIKKLIKKFIEYEKILYSEETGEIIILNWMKYNFINSRNTILCMNKEIKRVKNKELVKKLYDACIALEYDVASIFKGINVERAEILKNKFENSPLEGPCKDLGEEQTKEETDIKEESLNKQNIIADKSQEEKVVERFTKDVKGDDDKSLNKIILVLNEKMKNSTEEDIEIIREFTKEFEEEIIIRAIYEAAERKAIHPAYI